MIESGTLYEKLKQDHEKEDYRQDSHWLLEIESLGKAHLVKAIELPMLVTFGKMLVAHEHETMNVVLRLPATGKVELQIAEQLLAHSKCKAALYMLNPGKGAEACATWLFDDFEITGMKLQSFDRDRPAGTIDLAIVCAFREVRIV